MICKKYNIDLLGEKVETREKLEEAKKLGDKYFQGYYYSKPSVFLGKDMSVTDTSVFMLLVELLKEEFDIDKIEDVIKK